MLAPDGSLGVIAGTGAPSTAATAVPRHLVIVATPMALDRTAACCCRQQQQLHPQDRSRRARSRRWRASAASSGYSGDGGPAIDARMSRPLGLVLDPSRRVLLLGQRPRLGAPRRRGWADVHDLRDGRRLPVRHWPRRREGILAQSRTHLLSPAGSEREPLRDRPAAEHRRQIDPSRIARVVAGTGTAGYTGDGGLATQARLNYPAGLAMDRRGNLYVADSLNHVIRRIGTDGIIDTVAGTGTGGLRRRRKARYPRAPARAVRLSVRQREPLHRRPAERWVRRVDASGIITTISGR